MNEDAGPKRSGLSAFDEECRALARVLGTLVPEDFDRPSNCAPWTLHELVVHIVFSIRLPDRLSTASDDRPLASAADYFRRPERSTSGYRSDNVDRTRSIAATIAQGDAPSLFDDAWNRSSATFAELRADQAIDISGRVVSVDSYLLTRLMSVAAHGVDVAITLSRPPWTTPAALLSLRPVLVDLLGAEPPAAWSNPDLLEIGTGRRPLSETDRDALGERAALFPLLS